MKDDNSAKSIVFIVDDDPLVRDSLSSLLRSVGLQTLVFGSASEFLREKRPALPSCLVLDVRLPGESGLDFQAELASRNIHIPIIVRLQGTNAEEAKKLIDESGLKVQSAILLSEAAELVKKAVA